MKVQRYVAWASVMILTMALNAGAEPPTDPAHTVPASPTGLDGRPTAESSEEPAIYKELLKVINDAPAASGINVTDATKLKEEGAGKTDVEVSPTLNVSKENVAKFKVAAEFYQKYRAGISKCADATKKDASSVAMRALLDSYVEYLKQALGNDKNATAIVLSKGGGVVSTAISGLPIAPLDERVILAYQHAFHQVLDKKKSSFADLKGELDQADKDLLGFVDGSAQSLFGRKAVSTYTEEQFSKDAEAGAKAAIPASAVEARLAANKTPVKQAKIAELVKSAKDAIEARSKDGVTTACHAIVAPAPPPSPSKTATPTVTPTRTGTLPPPAPDQDKPTGTPTGTPTVTGTPTGGEQPTQPPTITEIPVPTGVVPPPPIPTIAENVGNLNNGLFDAIQRRIEDQQRALLDVVKDAQRAAQDAQRDALRAQQDAQNANNNQKDNVADALKAAIQSKNNDGEQQQQPFPFPQQQAALAPEQNDGPQFEPIPTPPGPEQTPPPAPFIMPPPVAPQSLASIGPDRPLFQDSPPPPMFFPQADPRASAALELLRFNRDVQQQASLLGAQRAATPLVTNGALLARRPPRRLTPGLGGRPGVSGLPTRYNAPGISPSLVRRNATRR